MNNQPEQRNSVEAIEDVSPPIGILGLVGIVFTMAAVYAISSMTGSPEIVKAVSIILVVTTIALGMWLGFAWVSAAAARDPESPTVVATRPDAMQAAPLVSRLEEHGIHAVATGTHTSGFQVEIASPVRVMVPKRELARALEVLGDEAGG